MKRRLGVGLLVVSFAPWAVYAALPFSGLPVGEAALLAGAVFVAGQLAFAASLVLLGSGLWQRLRARRGLCPCAQ